MKTPLKLTLIVALAASLAGCATEAELKKRDAQRAKEDAKYDAERDKRDEEDWQDFLDDYARDLGKRKSELTSAERADARREYGGRGRYHRYHYWY